MRVGLLYSEAGPQGDLTPVVEQILAAEQLGYDSVWIADAPFCEAGLGSAPIVLAALARRTRVVRLGTFRILPLDHPVRTAEDFAMIDLFSGGRLNFGVSAGSSAAPFAAAGIPFAERGDRMREALDIILAAWAFDEFAYGGTFYRFPSHTPAGTGLARRRQHDRPYRPQWQRGPEVPDFLTVTPKPLQHPRPPVWVLGDSREWITFAAERGHSLVFPPAPLPQLAAAAEQYDSAVAAARRDRSAVDLGVIVDLEIDGARTAPGTIERLHEVQDATGATQIIWHVPFPRLASPDLLAALAHFASAVQPLLQA